MSSMIGLAIVSALDGTRPSSRFDAAGLAARRVDADLIANLPAFARERFALLLSSTFFCSGRVVVLLSSSTDKTFARSLRSLAAAGSWDVAFVSWRALS